MIRITRYEEGDAPKLSRLIRRALVLVNSKDYPKSVITYMYNFFVPSRIKKYARWKTIFVARKGNIIIGTASICDNEISTVFVNPLYHGKGIGKKLMDKVESLAIRRGLKSVKLKASLTAREFYKKRGYRVVKPLRSKQFGTMILMRKRLTSSSP